MNIRLLAALLALAPLTAAAQPQLPTKEPAKKEAAKPAAKPADSGPVATVNGVAVPRARMEAFMREQTQRGMPDNEAMRGMVRDELINREVLAQEAQRTGVAKDPEVQAQLDMVRQEVLVNAYLRDWMRKHPVSAADIQKEYDRMKAQAGDKEYKARHILVETPEEAQKVIAELKKGAKFEDLAAKHSKDPGSAQRGGDLDWNLPSAFDRQFSEAMVKLEKGKYTPTPVQTRFGYHVIQLEDVREMKFPPLAEVRPRLQQQLAQNKIQELVKSLRSKAKVE